MNIILLEITELQKKTKKTLNVEPYLVNEKLTDNQTVGFTKLFSNISLDASLGVASKC